MTTTTARKAARRGTATDVAPLVATALIGTGRARANTIATSTPVDTLTDAIPDLDAEHALLLRAGAWAIYKQAGQVAGALREATGPHPPETLPVCPPAVAALIDGLLSGTHDELLPEAFERVARAGYRLPHILLPEALDRTDDDERRALSPTLGERGRWLAGFNKSWSWATQTLTDAGEGLPEDAATIWQEGTREQRVEILRRLRATDPAKARAWLEAVWKQEKADMRADLLDTLEVRLGDGDVPFLETCRSDRSANVREKAMSFLEQIPASALATRMRERAAAMLVYSGGKLDARPPTARDQDWKRDGLPDDAPSGVGERAWWLIQTLIRVPPSHWERHFAMTPEALIAATAGSKWRIQVVEAWTDAAERFGDTSWATPLWAFWRAASSKEIKQARGSRDGLLEQVAPLLSPAEREAWALAVMAEPDADDGPGLYDVLEALPAPWSEVVGREYLARLRAFAATLTPKSKTADPWDDTLSGAGVALPPSCFAAALEPIALPESGNWHIEYFRDHLDSFVETIRLRQRILEEIPT